VKMRWPNKVTGANAGGPRPLPMPTHSTARVAQFWRWRASPATNSHVACNRQPEPIAISLAHMSKPHQSASVLTLFVVLSLVTSCSRTSTPAPVSLEIVPGTGVGPIKFGMTMDEVKKALGQPDRTPGKPLQYSSLGLAVLPSSKDGTVGAIMLGDTGGGQLVDRFTGATAKGIGMKSKRQQIVAAYGPPESATPTAAALEELRYDSGRTQFTLRDGCVVHILLRR